MRFVILEDIRSAHNVGSIFRTADAAGVEKILLTGTTPDPIDRFGRVVKEIAKTSLGASTMVPWEHVSIEGAIQQLREQGAYIVAVELTPQSVSLYDFIPPGPVAYIFGNEVSGVSSYALTAADACLEIPMLGQKESLNVGVTAGVVLLHHPYVRKVS
jgi:23S rRNA (guanosine2251-2'-O)-methyltransferase